MGIVTGTGRVVDKSGNVGTGTATCEVQTFNLVIGPGQNVVSLVNNAPAGTATQPYRILVNGVHRVTTHLSPKAYTDLTINGTILGDIDLTGWVADGVGRWSVSGKLPAAYSDGGVPEFTTGPHANACKWREDVFLNGIMLKRVTTLDAVASNTFYADYTANKIYLGQDPTGKTVEMSKTQYAIRSAAARVRILGNWSVKHFATPSQNAAVQPEGPDWEIIGGVVQWVHAVGLKLSNSHRTIVRGTYLQDCGQMGASNASSHDTQWLSCRFLRNNNAMYQWDDWESGGIKTSRSNNVYFWDCLSLHNKGVGMWTDIDNDGTRYMWCRIEDNDSCGIRDEISFNTEIGYCQIHRNGLRHRTDSGAETTAGKDPGPYATDGININSSGGRNGGTLWVHDCTVYDNRNGIFAQQRNRTKDGIVNPEWILRNILLERNTVRSAVFSGAGVSGIGALSQTATRSTEIYTGDPAATPPVPPNVVCRNNQFGSGELIMRWTGTSWSRGTLAQAKAAGQEAGSTLLAS